MTRSEPVTLLVTLHAQAERRGRLHEELVVLAAMSRADEGCVRYDLLEEVETTDVFVLCEEWLDEASLARHNARPHVARFNEASPPLLLEPMRVQRLRRPDRAPAADRD